MKVFLSEMSEDEIRPGIINLSSSHFFSPSVRLENWHLYVGSIEVRAKNLTGARNSHGRRSSERAKIFSFVDGNLS
jgi:hypothetical protein